VAGLAGDDRRARPCVIVLDNYSVHRSRPVKEAIPGLAERGVHFCFLPAYSPDLNPIEALWKQVKYQDLPQRSYPTDVALQEAVEAALADRARRLAESTHLRTTCLEVLSCLILQLPRRRNVRNDDGHRPKPW
jgi:transposase